ncbi:hypothetical protein [Kordiimonas laminariae]|uniref:hypothetical protein n=1 Tax=Kordiimonas laminariae TaxID=2917717 RepID=UPI00248CAB9D|nr:hypothetical protein [Kordiimonas laminariae]
MGPSVDNNRTVTDVRATSSFSPTGDNRIDGLLSNIRYAADEDGSGLTTLTFSLVTETSTLDLSTATGDLAELSDLGLRNYGPLPERLAEVARDALKQIEQFSNLRFTEVPDGGDEAGTIRLGSADINGNDAAGIALFPGSGPLSGNVFIINGGIPASDPGYEVNVLHELLHALGIEHPEEAPDRGATPLPAEFLGHEYSVASQVGDGSISAKVANADDADLWPTTFMYLDILALQALYGKNETAAAGNDTYTFDLSERHYQTIYDLGGTDTLSFTGGNSDLKLDLTPGTWVNVGTTITYTDDATGNVVGTDNETVYLTPETVIERVLASGGDDEITGNDADNFIRAGGGADTVAGGAGSDAIYAGASDTGADTFSGGEGSDTLGGGAGNDTLNGGASDDILYGSTGADELTGAAGDDTLFGGAGDDVLSGGEGTDRLNGGTGNDTLTGGDGSDTFVFRENSGADRITDFNTTEDSLDLRFTETDFTDIASLQNAATEQSGGVSFDLGGGNSLFIEDIALADLASLTVQF